MKLPEDGSIAQYQEPNRGTTRKRIQLEEYNAKIEKKLNLTEIELQSVKAANKELKKNHKDEIRRRDRREMMIFASVGTFVVVYALGALIVRGFV